MLKSFGATFYATLAPTKDAAQGLMASVLASRRSG